MVKIVMICPNGHKPIIDKEKSNDNWTVYVDPCPKCGQKLKIITESNNE